ncbi:MAG: translesion DNA synthesis-associated protein ImuA [Burkholderiales bacterium]|jgi:cell division inhibitor SulA
MSAALDTLLHNAAIWHGNEHSRAQSDRIASGFGKFDEILGGWPLGALIELIPRHEGIGELSVLLPALARLSKDERWIALIDPPYIPYAPALFHAGIDLAKIVVIRAPGTADTLWAMNQALHSGACSAVIGWPASITEQAIRRLQLAAETGQALGAYFTRPGATARTSPVPYRLRIDGSIDNIRIEVLKRRGGNLASALCVGPANARSVDTYI